MGGHFPAQSMNGGKLMDSVEKSTLLSDEMIMELLELLKQNSMPQEANHTFELCAYIDSLEKKLDADRRINKREETLERYAGRNCL